MHLFIERLYTVLNKLCLIFVYN